MKQFYLVAIIVFVFFLVNSNPVLAQVVVKVKPVPPKVKMLAPQKPGEGFVLIPGHWIWHRPSKNYVWVGPNWTPERENRKWVLGHWRELPKGWKWIPGHWEKETKKRYFFNLF